MIMLINLKADSPASNLLLRHSRGRLVKEQQLFSDSNQVADQQSCRALSHLLLNPGTRRSRHHLLAALRQTSPSRERKDGGKRSGS